MWPFSVKYNVNSKSWEVRFCAVDCLCFAIIMSFYIALMLYIIAVSVETYRLSILELSTSQLLQTANVAVIIIFTSIDVVHRRTILSIFTEFDQFDLQV